MEFLKYIDVVAEGLRRDGKDTTMAEYKQALGVYNKRLKALSKMLGEDVQLSSVSPRESWAVAAFEGGMALPMITKTLWILWISCVIN